MLSVQEYLTGRHYGFSTSPDFDLSPCYRVVKPNLEGPFDHLSLAWSKEARREGD